MQERGADDAILFGVACWRRHLPRCWSPRLRTARRCCTPEPSPASLLAPRSAVFEAARQAGWELGFGPLYPQDLFSRMAWLASSVRLSAGDSSLNGTALAHDPELTATLLNYLAQQS